MIAQTFSRRFSTAKHLLSVALTTLLLMLPCLVPPCSQGQTKSPYTKQTLLEALRRNAQTKDLSTKDFVDYIEQRGVDFEMTTPDEARFRNAGAPPEVIAAIKRNYRPVFPRGSGALVINSTVPGCSVFVNG